MSPPVWWLSSNCMGPILFYGGTGRRDAHFLRRHETSSPQSSQLTALKGLCLRTGAVAKALLFFSHVV